jgi:SAM-dependent methyltransferase
MAETEASHWWFAGRRAILASVIAGLGLPAEAKVLEIGSGTGGNLVMLAEFGRVCAMEMDDAARALSAQRTGGRFDIRAGVCPAAVPFAGERFDLVCLLDVLEHIEDDAGTLVEAGRRLAPGGRMLVTVPAYRWLWSAHDEFLHHKRRYSSAELRAKAERAGLSVDRMTHFNAVLFPLVAVARLLDRRRGKAAGSPLPPPALNRLLRRLFGAERFFLQRRDFPFGVSLLAVLRLPGEVAAQSTRNSAET